MRPVLTALLFSWSVSVAVLAQDAPKAAGAVLPAQRRLQALKTAARVIETREPTWKALVADLPDPFFRVSAAAPTEEAAAVAAVQRPEHTTLDILRALAPQIEPTGAMVIGDERFLLLGGTRYGVGSTIKLTFEGLVYEVVFSSIERNSYALQLDDQMLRREFK